MDEIVTHAPTAKRAAYLTLAAPKLLAACEDAIGTLCALATLPDLPVSVRRDIAKTVARACEAQHLAKFGTINPPRNQIIGKEEA